MPVEYKQYYHPRIVYDKVVEQVPVERYQQRIEYDVVEHAVQHPPVPKHVIDQQRAGQAQAQAQAPE